MDLVIDTYLFKPYAQAVVFLVVTLGIFVLLRLKNANALYTIAGIMYVLFILTNSVLIFSSNSIWSYFFISLLVTSSKEALL